MNKNVRYPGGTPAKRKTPAVRVPLRDSSGRATVKNRQKANLGKELEGYIDATNEAYIMRNQAIVFRQNPEVTVVRSQDEITGAFYKKKAGLDFIGLSNGHSFTFDTKETQSKTAFPLSNIEDHQYQSMLQYTGQGGLAFLLIRFIAWQRIYYVPLHQLSPWWIAATGDGRKSIPYEWISENCEVVGAGGGLAIDYLPFVKAWGVAKNE